MSQLIIETGAKVLFQGDSITDTGRQMDETYHMGSGYPFLISSWLSAGYPEKKIQFVNRGISGNRVCDLENRWTEDCVALQPDWVSILIGINDTARCCVNHERSDVPEYEAAYRRILDRVRSETKARVIILEPFLLPIDEEQLTWRIDLDTRIQAVRRVARDYDVLLIPLDDLFASVAEKNGTAFWSPDGVHPTPAGHALIAQEWIKTVGS